MNKLTVIVPVYNGEKTIGKCLESILGSSIKTDVLVIDDGSTDGTVNIVESHIKENPQIRLLTKENKGIASARNFALDHIETAFFTFLDSDDYIEADIYEKMLNRIESDSSDICFADFLWEYDDGTTRLGSDTGYKDRHEILEKMYATLWNKVYRTSWVRNTEIRFPEGLVYEDASFLYRLALDMKKVSYVEDISVHYLQHVGSITHTFDLRINDMIEVFKGIRQYYEEKNAFDDYKDELEYLFAHFFLGNSYLRACRIKDNKTRNDTLDKGYEFLVSQFPNYHKNKYLQSGGKKNFYYRHTNRFIYKACVPIFRTMYKLGFLK